MSFEMLELYEAKVSYTVRRGERRSNPLDSPDDCGTIALLSIQNVPILMCISGNGFVQSSDDNEV